MLNNKLIKVIKSIGLTVLHAEERKDITKEEVLFVLRKDFYNYLHELSRRQQLELLNDINFKEGGGKLWK